MNIFTKKNQILLQELVRTDFKLRYQGSLIGYLWSILKPVMLFIIMYLVFVRFLRFGDAVPHFAVALLLGLTLWNFFAETSNMGMVSIVARGDLLRKVNFSKPIIIFSVVSNALINLCISLVVVIVFALIDGVTLRWNVLLVFPLLLELVLLATGVAFLLSTVFVRFRDLGPVWEVFMQAGLYGTPIIYPITLISATHPTVGTVMMLNPMAQIVQDMRYLLTFSDNVNPTIWQMVDNPFIVAIPYLLPLVLFGIGFWVFTKNAGKFAEIV